jgi:hypothetical protein
VPRAVDARHTVNLEASYRTNDSRWTVSAGWLYHSGQPYTPAYFRYDTLSGFVNVSEHLGPINSGRLPEYHRASVRATRTWSLRSSQIDAYFDVFNAFRNRNVFAYGYSTSVGSPVYTARDPVPSVPLIPTFGISWRF